MRDSEKTNCHHGGGIFISGKGKASPEEKGKIVRQYQAGKLSLRQAAQRVGVDEKTIRAARYDAEGADGFLPHQANRVYSPELKEKAVREYLSGGGSAKEICKKYKLRNGGIS